MVRTPGMEAHDLVVEHLQPALVEVAQGNPIPVEALVVPELEYLMLGVEDVEAEPVQAEDAPAAMRAMGREAVQTYLLYAEPAAAADLQVALQPVGTVAELVEAVGLMPGYNNNNNILQLLPSTRACSRYTVQ